MQVGFVVLHAVDALGVDRAELEVIGVGQNAAGLKDLGDDLRHRQMLENLLVMVVAQVGQLRHQADAVAGQAFAGVALLDAIDQAVNDAFAGGAEGQAAGLVQQFFEFQVGARADQFDVKTEGLIEGFATDETEYLKVSGNAFQREGNMDCVCVQHALNSVLWISRSGWCRIKPPRSRRKCRR
ncbi:hypothetical protein D3C84_816790 [compost metagenome]